MTVMDHSKLPHFLIVDADAGRGVADAKAISDRFPPGGVIVQHVMDIDRATDLLNQQAYTGVVVHNLSAQREGKIDPARDHGTTLVERIRQIEPSSEYPMSNDANVNVPITLVFDNHPQAKQLTPAHSITTAIPLTQVGWEDRVADSCVAYAEAQSIDPTRARITAQPARAAGQARG